MPLATLTVGQELDVAVLGVHVSKAPVHHTLNVSAKTSAFDAARAGAAPSPIRLDELRENQRFVGSVQTVARDHLWVLLTAGLRGRVRQLHAAEDPERLAALSNTFKPGQAVRVSVAAVDVPLERVDLTMLGERFAPYAQSGAPPKVLPPPAAVSCGTAYAADTYVCYCSPSLCLRCCQQAARSAEARSGPAATRCERAQLAAASRAGRAARHGRDQELRGRRRDRAPRLRPRLLRNHKSARRVRAERARGPEARAVCARQHRGRRARRQGPLAAELAAGGRWRAFGCVALRTRAFSVSHFV